jgi:hypothetical protein
MAMYVGLDGHAPICRAGTANPRGRWLLSTKAPGRMWPIEISSDEDEIVQGAVC